MLDSTQGNVVEKDVQLLEKNLLHKMKRKEKMSKKERVDKILSDARKEVWKKDPERKKVQQALEEGDIKIEDIIFNDWIPFFFFIVD